MSLVDELVAAVEGAGEDAGKTAVVVGFLKAAGPAVERLGAEEFERVMESAAGGEGLAVVIAQMSEQEVVGMLGEVEGAMSTAAAGHAADLAARAAALEALKAVALSVVAKLVVAAL